jgi:hypothetical protein
MPPLSLSCSSKQKTDARTSVGSFSRTRENASSDLCIRLGARLVLARINVGRLGSLLGWPSSKKHDRAISCQENKRYIQQNLANEPYVRRELVPHRCLIGNFSDLYTHVAWIWTSHLGEKRSSTMIRKELN